MNDRLPPKAAQLHLQTRQAPLELIPAPAGIDQTPGNPDSDMELVVGFPSEELAVQPEQSPATKHIAIAEQSFGDKKVALEIAKLRIIARQKEKLEVKYQEELNRLDETRNLGEGEKRQKLAKLEAWKKREEARIQEENGVTNAVLLWHTQRSILSQIQAGTFVAAAEERSLLQALQEVETARQARVQSQANANLEVSAETDLYIKAANRELDTRLKHLILEAVTTSDSAEAINRGLAQIAVQFRDKDFAKLFKESVRSGSLARQLVGFIRNCQSEGISLTDAVQNLQFSFVKDQGTKAYNQSATLAERVIADETKGIMAAGGIVVAIGATVGTVKGLTKLALVTGGWFGAAAIGGIGGGVGGALRKVDKLLKQTAREDAKEALGLETMSGKENERLSSYTVSELIALKDENPTLFIRRVNTINRAVGADMFTVLKLDNLALVKKTMGLDLAGANSETRVVYHMAVVEVLNTWKNEILSRMNSEEKAELALAEVSGFVDNRKAAIRDRKWQIIQNNKWQIAGAAATALVVGAVTMGAMEGTGARGLMHHQIQALEGKIARGASFLSEAAVKALRETNLTDKIAQLGRLVRIKPVNANFAAGGTKPYIQGGTGAQSSAEYPNPTGPAHNIMSAQYADVTASQAKPAQGGAGGKPMFRLAPTTADELEAMRSPAAVTTTAEQTSSVINHTVTKGDTLSKYADQIYGLTDSKDPNYIQSRLDLFEAIRKMNPEAVIKVDKPNGGFDYIIREYVDGKPVVLNLPALENLHPVDAITDFLRDADTPAAQIARELGATVEVGNDGQINIVVPENAVLGYDEIKVPVIMGADGQPDVAATLAQAKTLVAAEVGVDENSFSDLNIKDNGDVELLDSNGQVVQTIPNPATAAPTPPPAAGPATPPLAPERIVLVDSDTIRIDGQEFDVDKDGLLNLEKLTSLPDNFEAELAQLSGVKFLNLNGLTTIDAAEPLNLQGFANLESIQLNGLTSLDNLDLRGLTTVKVVELQSLPGYELDKLATSVGLEDGVDIILGEKSPNSSISTATATTLKGKNISVYRTIMQPNGIPQTRGVNLDAIIHGIELSADELSIKYDGRVYTRGPAGIMNFGGLKTIPEGFAEELAKINGITQIHFLGIATVDQIPQLNEILEDNPAIQVLSLGLPSVDNLDLSKQINLQSLFLNAAVDAKGLNLSGLTNLDTITLNSLVSVDGLDLSTWEESKASTGLATIRILRVPSLPIDEVEKLINSGTGPGTFLPDNTLVYLGQGIDQGNITQEVAQKALDQNLRLIDNSGKDIDLRAIANPPQAATTVPSATIQTSPTPSPNVLPSEVPTDTTVPASPTIQSTGTVTPTVEPTVEPTIEPTAEASADVTASFISDGPATGIEINNTRYLVTLGSYTPELSLEELDVFPDNLGAELSKIPGTYLLKVPQLQDAAAINKLLEAKNISGIVFGKLEPEQISQLRIPAGSQLDGISLMGIDEPQELSAILGTGIENLRLVNTDLDLSEVTPESVQVFGANPDLLIGVKVAGSDYQWKSVFNFEVGFDNRQILTGLPQMPEVDLQNPDLTVLGSFVGEMQKQDLTQLNPDQLQTYFVYLEMVNKDLRLPAVAAAIDSIKSEVARRDDVRLSWILGGTLAVVGPTSLIALYHFWYKPRKAAQAARRSNFINGAPK